MAKFTVTTWNINSVRLRLKLVEKLLKAAKPDVLCLQEIKCLDELFPAAALAKLGYKHQHIHGMKGYNGVAILSKVPLRELEVYNRCGKEDRRHISARLPNGIELHNVYLPAGGYEPDPKANPKFQHKLDYIDDLARWGEKLKKRPRILLGDLNVAPLENDVYDHKKMLRVVSHTPVEVKKFANMQAANDWVDTGRHFIAPEKKLYSWWSYHGEDDWEEKDYGRRLDHIWVSKDLKASLSKTTYHKAARGWSFGKGDELVGPSDHAPITLELDC
ncbi:MAG: exodeoxyribonuclease III [Bdellovibrionales bacterium]